MDLSATQDFLVNWGWFIVFLGLTFPIIIGLLVVNFLTERTKIAKWKISEFFGRFYFWALTPLIALAASLVFIASWKLLTLLYLVIIVGLILIARLQWKCAKEGKEIGKKYREILSDYILAIRELVNLLENMSKIAEMTNPIYRVICQETRDHVTGKVQYILLESSKSLVFLAKHQSWGLSRALDADPSRMDMIRMTEEAKALSKQIKQLRKLADEVGKLTPLRVTSKLRAVS